MKTLEALISIIIFLIFIVAALVYNQPIQREIIPQDIVLLQDSILDKIQTDTSLRMCLIANDTICINDTISPLVPYPINYDFEICNEVDPSDCSVKTFPVDLTIYVDSILIQENQSAILRLFLWKE